MSKLSWVRTATWEHPLVTQRFQSIWDRHPQILNAFQTSTMFSFATKPTSNSHSFNVTSWFSVVEPSSKDQSLWKTQRHSKPYLKNTGFWWPTIPSTIWWSYPARCVRPFLAQSVITTWKAAETFWTTSLLSFTPSTCSPYCNASTSTSKWGIKKSTMGILLTYSTSMLSKLRLNS